MGTASTGSPAAGVASVISPSVKQAGQPHLKIDVGMIWNVSSPVAAKGIEPARQQKPGKIPAQMSLPGDQVQFSARADARDPRHHIYDRPYNCEREHLAGKDGSDLWRTLAI